MIDYVLYVLPNLDHPLFVSQGLVKLRELKVKKSSEHYSWKLRLLLLVAVVDATVMQRVAYGGK